MTQLNTVLLSVNAESIAVLTVDGEALELKFVLECSAKGSSSDQGAIIDAALLNNLLFVLLDKGIVCILSLFAFPVCVAFFILIISDNNSY